MTGEASPHLREVARSAARWLVLLESGAASEQDHARLNDWRAADAEHERAWQRAEALRGRFQSLPSHLAMASLDRPDPSRRQLLKRVLTVAALTPAAWWLVRQSPLDLWRADLRTGTGERHELPLAGGGKLLLNTGSSVNLDISQHRVELLRGELALTAAGSPYRVVTSFGEVGIAEGEVCVRTFEGRCEVASARGIAVVTPLTGPVVRLSAGQRLSIDARGAGQPAPWDTGEPDWRRGVLTVHDQPLGDFLRELDRYRPGVLHWEPILERLRISGSFQLADTDRILTLLAGSLPLTVRMRSRYWVTLEPRQPA